VRKRTLDVREQSLVFWEVGNETLDGSSDHGVFAHQDNGLASEGGSDFVHLLRRDIVDADDEDGFVLIEQALQLVEVYGFGTGLAPHDFFEDEVRMFKGKCVCVICGLVVVGCENRSLIAADARNPKFPSVCAGSWHVTESWHYSKF